MQSFSIHTYSGQLHQDNSFYILNKGNNCGKPGWTPWRNSFIIKSDSSNVNKLYWLCYSLHLSNGFRLIRYGSVFDTMRIGELHNLLMQFCFSDINDNDIHRLQLMEQLEAATVEKLRTISNLKQDYARAITRAITKKHTKKWKSMTYGALLSIVNNMLIHIYSMRASGDRQQALVRATVNKLL